MHSRNPWWRSWETRWPLPSGARRRPSGGVGGSDLDCDGGLIALALALTRRLSVDRPGKVQCALEWTVEFLNGFVKTNIGAHWRPFAPWLGTVASTSA